MSKTAILELDGDSASKIPPGSHKLSLSFDGKHQEYVVRTRRKMKDGHVKFFLEKEAD